ncbi:hypothetical protein [Magnetococcus marinus]|uniref:hypothetical protein n=1 Tax=Magnetococcus marinus TaxID=1124597 RepID=UPI00003811F6|nr:hypothetical protein [Magnetococcus marinus]
MAFMNDELPEQVRDLLEGQDYQQISEAHKDQLVTLIQQRLGRMKWVDEHVIATDLMLLQMEKPELFDS